MSYRHNRTSFTPRQRAAILKRDPICRHCKRRPSTQADHIIPDAQGGPTTTANGQGLCDECHRIKTAAERQIGIDRKQARLKQPQSQHPGIR